MNTLTHHRVDRGTNNREGMWAVVRVDRDVDDLGDVRSVHRRVVDWFPSEAAAKTECARLSGNSVPV